MVEKIDGIDLIDSFDSLKKRSFFMDYKTILIVFGSVFIAELGDKTQLATLLFASDKEVSKLVVFIGASLALIATSAIAVFAGDVITRFITAKQLSVAAGIGFIAIGIWTLVKS